MKRMFVVCIAMICLLGGCTFVTTDTSVTATDKQTTKTNVKTQNVVSITLYRKEQMFSRDEAKLVKVIDDAQQINSICNQLTNAAWTYHEENDWVKCQPTYASYILVFKQQGAQTVLHIPYADDRYIAVGNFEDTLTYAQISEKAKANRKNGVDDFKRYTISPKIITQLCKLF